MRKMINESTKPITEIGYRNKSGNIELVKITHPRWASLESDLDTELSQIYYEDIPKLITALQEAHALHLAQGGGV